MVIPGVSLIVCTHNGAKLLPDTIKHILKQQVDQHVKWEFILIDNGSDDNSGELVKKLWSISTPCRIIREDKIGLMHARNRGVAEARYEFISFIDDDNWIDSAWVTTVISVFSEHPETGICGGEIFEAPELEPPSWFDGIKMSYAIGKQGDKTGDVTETRGHIWGAGMSFRKSAYEAIVDAGFSPILNDRQGKKLLAGGDTEIAYNFRMAGWKLWFDDRLKLHHFLPKSRLEWSYLLKLYKGFGYSHVIFEIYHMTLYRNKSGVIPYLFYEQITRLTYFLFWMLKHLFSKTEGKINRLYYQMYLSGLIFLIQNVSRVNGYHRQIESVSFGLRKVRERKMPKIVD